MKTLAKNLISVAILIVSVLFGKRWVRPTAGIRAQKGINLRAALTRDACYVTPKAGQRQGTVQNAGAIFSRRRAGTSHGVLFSID